MLRTRLVRLGDKMVARRVRACCSWCCRLLAAVLVGVVFQPVVYVAAAVVAFTL